MKNKPQVKKSHYSNLNYSTKARWSSYWYQINEVVNLNPQTVLEIGVGNRVVSDYLKKLGLKVTTCDFDENLKPDIVADVCNLPFKDKSFDVILCAEVLEHLPFKKFIPALKEIRRVAKTGAVVTLPHYGLTNLYFGIKFFPFLPKKEFCLKIDYPIKHIFLGEHYWEIGKKGYSLTKIKKAIEKAGFSIKKSFYPSEDPRHHFFVLSK